MELRQEISIKQLQTISPQLIQAQRLLQVTTLELRDEIVQEMSENPALEMEEIMTCPHCHRPMEGYRCEYCGQKPGSADAENEQFIEQQILDYDPDEAAYSGAMQGGQDDDRPTFLDFYQQDGDFHEILLNNFYTLDFPAHWRWLGEYLIYTIDEDGYLRLDMDSLRAQALFVIEILKHEPSVEGGYRTAQTGRLMQWHRIWALKDMHPLVKRIMQSFFEERFDADFDDLRELAAALESSPERDVRAFYDAVNRGQVRDLLAFLSGDEQGRWIAAAQAAATLEPSRAQALDDCLMELYGDNLESLITGAREKLIPILDSLDQQVEHFIGIIQTMDPPGIGARNPREALLIQLNSLTTRDNDWDLAHRIIFERFEDLGKSRIPEIAAAFEVTAADVNRALDFIRRNLTPYPGHALIHRPAEPVQIAKPSIAFLYDGKKLSYEILELNDFRLRINPFYVDMYKKHQEGVAGLPRSDVQHVKEYFKRAKFFIDSIGMRRNTIEKIAKVLMNEQRDFLIHGLPHFNSELTQTKLAEKIAEVSEDHEPLHESTVSRAMSGKFVQLPGGSIVSFAFFFDSSIRPKEYIRNFISAEDPEHPLSDSDLMEQLAAQGMELARRTVAKYREEMNIPSSFMRKRMRERRATWQ